MKKLVDLYGNLGFFIRLDDEMPISERSAAIDLIGACGNAFRSRSAQHLSRIVAEFSPMPPVNTSASTFPSTA
jgi:hypothetical protein